MSKSILSVLILISFFFALSSSAQTPVPDLQAIIKQLQDQIKLLNQQIIELQSSLKETQEEVQIVKTELKLTKSLRKGESSDEVRQLQEFLSQFPDIYPEGFVTGFFGSLTEIAVKRFQQKQGIESIGIVGPKTLQKLNEFSAKATPAIPAIPAIPGLSPAIPAIPAVSASLSLPFHPASASQPAIPAIPAIPAVPGVSTAIPAIPAQPSSSTSTPIPSISVSPSPTASTSATKTPTPTPTSTPIPTLTPTPSPSNLLAPTISYLKWGSYSNKSDLVLNGLFKYIRTSDTKALNVYLQYSGDSTYTKYSYPISQNYGIISGLDGTTLYGSLEDSGVTSWQWSTGNRPASAFITGTYRFYVTALGTDDREGSASSVVTSTLFGAPVITSPANGATAAFPITISLGQTKSGQYYKYLIFEGIGQKYESNYTQSASITINSNQWLVNGNTYQIHVGSYDNSSGASSSTKQPNAESSFVFSVPTPTPTPVPAPTGSVSFPLLNQVSATANILDALKSVLQTLSNLLSLIGR